MPNPANPHYLVLSDMHFGTSQTSMNSDRYRGALIAHMASRAPWEEIVLTGDLLDLNLSTLTKSIEGAQPKNGDPRLCGFRQFLGELQAAMAIQAPGKTLRDLAKAWVYVPGNHDYKIWDILSAKVVCEDVLASGRPIGSIPTPLMRYTWKGAESFFAGIFVPYGAQDQVVVDYPYHEVNLGPQPAKMVLTHGHYLERTETRGEELSDDLPGPPGSDIDKAVRKIFIRTAQYQTLANAVSFTNDARNLVDLMFGPGSVFNKVREWLIKPIFPQACHGQAISEKHLRNIEAYLEHFCKFSTPPRWFVFGHTHRQDKAKTARLGIEVYNAGSCYDDRGLPITFLQIDAPVGQQPNIQLMCIDKEAKVRPSPS